MNTCTYPVPIEIVFQLKKEIDKLEKKVKKGKLPPFSIEYGDTFTKNVTDDLGRTHEAKFRNVTVSTNPVVLEGYEFMAKVTFEHSKPTISARPGVELPKIFQETDNHCDHCGHIRQRKIVYVFRNENTNEYYQVGSSCLKDFFGYEPELLVQSAALDEWFINNIRDNHNLGIGEWFSGRGERTYDIDYVMKVSCAMIDNHGFVSRKMIETNPERYIGTTATGDMVRSYITRMSDSGWENFSITDTHARHSKIVLNWIREYLSKMESKNTYFHNLSAIIEDEYATWKDISFVASIFSVYDREMEKKNVKYKNEYVGEIKKREIFADLSIKSIKSFDSDFGVKHLIQFVDNQKRVLIWWASTDIDKYIDIKDNNQMVSIKATVKAHKEWNGCKQTAINRAVIM